MTAKISTLRDNFNAGSIDAGLWDTTGTVTVSNGKATLTPQVGSSVLNGDVVGYDLTDSQLVANIPTVTGNGAVSGSSGDLQSVMVVRLDTNNRLLIRKLTSNWVVTKIVGGVATNIFTTAYSSTNHRWWRIREAFDTGAGARVVYFDAGTDGFHWTNYFSILTPFDVTNVTAFFSAGWSSGVEPSPGTMQIESVNPVLLADAAGNPAASFTDQAVTNNTATIYQISATGSTPTTGSAAISIVSSSGGSSVRDVAGNLAPGFTDSPVTNNTQSNSQSISASGQTLTTGSANAVLILSISATGTSGWGIPYDKRVFYPDTVLYDPIFTAGSANLNILAAGATNSLTGSGTTQTTGSASITVIPAGGISAIGTTLFTGSALLTIPVVNISATGILTTTGSAAFLLNNLLYASGFTRFTGSLAVDILTPLFTFEPPIAYDLPPTLPDPKPKYLNAHAKWKPGQRRGRTLLKEAGQYVLVDTPTVDRTIAAEKVYMGGHIYTINQDEAYELTAAGFTVTAAVR